MTANVITYRGRSSAREMGKVLGFDSETIGLLSKLVGSWEWKDPKDSLARQFRDALSMPLVLLGGINRRDTIEHAMAEGFEFVAMARALLREPDLVNKLAGHQTETGLCVHCNKCMPTIYSGTRCVLVPEPTAG